MKDIVKQCQYPSKDDKMVWRTELLFHATKHFEVKKWVRSKKKREDITYVAILQHAKEHEMTVKDFNWHKSNGRAAIATSIDEIHFNYRKGNGNGYKPKGSQGKPCGKCGQSHLPRECPAWGKKCHKCGNKNHFTMCCRMRDIEESQDRDKHRLTHRESWNRRESRHRCRRHTSEDSEDRSRSRSVTQSTHSIELSSFQDPCNLHERLPYDPYERLSFKDPDKGNTLKKTFHAISRSRSVLSIRNKMGPDGKTKILMILNIKLPHRPIIDNVRVKVDDGAEANISPLDSFRNMFPHALDVHSYPKDGFLRKSRTNLKCYNDRKLINHCSITLKLQHYSDESFQDHSFYVVETRMPKDIIVGYAASIRLGLLEVLCKNISKSVSAIEKQDKYQLQRFLSRPLLENRWQNITEEPESCIKVLPRPSTQFFQDHGYVHMQWHSFQDPSQHTGQEKAIEVDPFQDPWCRQHKSHQRNIYWYSFQDPADTQGRNEHNRCKLTHFKTLGIDGIWVIRKMCTETSFKTPANTQERNEQHRHMLTHFKTPVINGICATRGKDDANRVKDTVKNRGRKTPFKTLGKSGRKVSFQDKEHKVGKANSFKNWPQSRTQIMNWFLSRPLMIGSKLEQHIVTWH